MRDLPFDLSDALALGPAPGLPPPAPTTAADVMTPFPCTVHPTTPIRDALALMTAHRVRHLPVVDAHSAVIGMLSDRDVRTAGLDRRLVVGDVMSYPPVVIPFDTPLGEIAHRFALHRYGALPVVDRFGALLGIVSYVDILDAFS